MDLLEQMKLRLARMWIADIVNGTESTMMRRPEIPSFYELWERFCSGEKLPVFESWLNKQGLF